MLKTRLIDGTGTNSALKINEEGTIGVVVHQHPPIGETVHGLPFQALFTNDAGSSDMRVVASIAAPQTFIIRANADADTYIKTISIEIADAGATLSKFGNITALTNGVTINWITQASGNIPISSDLKSNWDFVRLAGGNPAFGDAAGSFRASNVIGSSEGYIPFIDVSQVFGMAYGLQLRKGTNDCVLFTIRDDTTGVDSFNAIAYGLTL